MLDKLSGFLSKLKAQYDDDAIDRLNYLYTNVLIILFAITLAAQNYVGEPLQCWIPNEMPGGWEQYIERYCFVENTYFVPMNNDLYLDEEMREKKELQYYQWVPFVLALQAMLFYVPRMMWNIASFQSGINLTALIQSAFISKKEGDMKKLRDAGDVDSGIKTAADHLQSTLMFNRSIGQKHRVSTPASPFRGRGSFMTVLYLICKVLYVVNIVSQFIILNKFLGSEYTWWGAGILHDLVNGVDWKSSGHFPRVTMCDVEVRRLGGVANLQRYTVQCVLQINMFSEKIYIFLWWWFVVVAVVTILNVLYWFYVSLFSSMNISMIRQYLYMTRKVEGHLSMREKENLRRFINDVLQTDGCTTVRLIKDNAGEIVAARVVAELWEKCYPSIPSNQFRELTPNAPSPTTSEASN